LPSVHRTLRSDDFNNGVPLFQSSPRFCECHGKKTLKEQRRKIAASQEETWGGGPSRFDNFGKSLSLLMITTLLNRRPAR
jgi:hypothetical protein